MRAGGRWGEDAGGEASSAMLRLSACRETPTDRLRLAMAMQREGTALMRRNLQRAHPELSDAEIDALFQTWLLSREPDAPGHPVPWPRRRPIPGLPIL